MEEKKNKCPLCNKKLVMKDGVPTCPDCGYRDPYRASGSQPQTDSGQQPRMNYSQPQPNYGQQSKTGSYAAAASSGNGTKKKNPSAIALVTIITVVAVGTVVSVMVGLIYSAIFADGRNEWEWSTYEDTGMAVSSYAAENQEPSVPSSTQSGVSSVSHLSFDPPESQLLQEFVSQLFDKSAASVTREELNSVIRVEIRDMRNYNGTEVTYELSDGTAGICYLESTRVDPEDFKCFPNIQTLDLGRESLDWDTDWHGLTSLTSLTCEVDLDSLAGYMDVSQLTSLTLYRDFMMRDCSGLDAYRNLEYLRLDCDGYGMELTGISQAAALKTLIIEDGDNITDFRELYDMTQLKELSIESDGLRDIGFIKDMSGLESLELVSTGLLQITAIADRADTLKCLRLHQNYSVQDYSAVFACTGLEELELYVDYDFEKEMVMPDLSMMSGLKVLALGNYEKFPGLEDLTALESLTLMDAGFFGDDGGLTGLEKLTGLKTLSLIDMSMESKLLEAFAGVTSLETIDLTDSFIWGDLNTVFGMPNLKALDLEDTDFGLSLDGMPVSESLLELDLTDAHVHRLKEDGSWDYSASNTQIQLGEFTEFFEHMPNLTVLKVPEQELQDVQFAENLPQLAYLDITNNYVTDLSPLAGLSQLKVIVCENNPVHDMTGLKDVIVIE